jgi:hypothetical protein
MYMGNQIRIQSPFGGFFCWNTSIKWTNFAESPEEDLIFAGRILEASDTNQLRAIQKSKEDKGLATHKTPIFSFVVLSKEEFDKIKQEIKVGPGPARLKELVDLLA